MRTPLNYVAVSVLAATIAAGGLRAAAQTPQSAQAPAPMPPPMQATGQGR
jgi:hypothetical protein